MKNTIQKAIGAALAILLAVPLLSVQASAETQFAIRNPYRNVNWETYRSYRAELHAHSTASDGYSDFSAMIEAYYEKGYDVLAMTDHGVVDRGWIRPNVMPFRRLMSRINPDSYPRLEVTGLSKDRFCGISRDEGRDERGLLRVPFGIEHNPSVGDLGHVNSWFADWGQGFPGGDGDYETPVRGVDQAGGLCVINHPSISMGNGSYGYNDIYEGGNVSYVHKVQRLFEKYSALIGIDISRPADHKLWDILLRNLAPSGRNVFGIGTSDAHSIYQIDGGDWVWALMPDNTVKNLRASLEDGAFFAASRYVSNYDQLDALREATGRNFSGYWAANPDAPEPMVTGIVAQDGVISIRAEHHEVILWISDGRVAGTGDTLILAECETLGAYVRAEIWGEGGILYTQPFLLSYEGMPAGSPVPKDFKDAYKPWNGFLDGQLYAFIRRFLIHPAIWLVDLFWKVIW